MLLFGAASAALVAVIVSQRHVRSSVERYLCPMHPEVVSAARGECPICHMALELAPPETTRTDGARLAPGKDGENAGDSLSLAKQAATLLRNSVGFVRRHVLTQELRVPAWLERDGVVATLIPIDEISALPAHASGTFFQGVEPRAGVGVRMTSEVPVAWDRSLSRVLFEPVRGARPLPEGAFGWVTLAPLPRTVLVVPDTAIRQDAAGAYVLAVSADARTLRRRKVETGRFFSGLAVVTAGLADREPVLVKNSFFMDAERRLRAPRAITVMP